MSAVRFLVADSNPALRTFMQQLLLQCGLKPAWVRCAPDPEAALALARDCAPDFVLTDSFSTHPTNGIALVQGIRQLQPDLRWAMTGAADDQPLHEAARAQGALFFLGKPFTAAAMKSALARALQTWAQDHPQVGRYIPGAQQTATPPRAITLPPLQTFKTGDAVEYLGVRDTVRHVIFRRGELMVQLAQTPGIVSADKLRKR